MSSQSAHNGSPPIPSQALGPGAALSPDSPADPAAYPPGRQPASVIILTRNEEVNIAECLRTLSWSDDIVVLDSFSTDRTVEIALSFPNVRVVQRVFDTEYKQRNFGLHDIKYKHPWLYICDADERVTSELREEILREINLPTQQNAAFRLRYKNMFFGKWIRRSSSYPVWLIRLMRPDLVRYEIRQTNVHPIVDGRIGSLNEHFIHYSFHSGLKRWFAKHNFYSDREALEAVTIRSSGLPRVSDLFSRDPMIRRRTAKNFSFYLKFRGAMRWLHDAIVRLGVLDGRAGLRYISMISMYEYWIELKTTEQERSWRQRNEALVQRMLTSGKGGAVLPAVHQPPVDSQGNTLVDVMIPTLNEAGHIAETVRNALHLGPVYVLDSLSTDGTQKIARDAGATVVEHPFEDYSKQKNWGLDNLPMTGKWVFILDADERLTPELVEETKRIVAAPDARDGYYVNRIVIMMGRAIGHGGMFPSWNLRFFKRGSCRYEDRSVHEHMVCSGTTGYLKHLMLHIRRESVSEYLTKHIRYADMESDEWVKMRTGVDRSARAGRLFRDLLKYRLYLRRDIWPSIPFKPAVRFIYMYLFRLGFLDGAAGWHLANLMACYEYMIELLYADKMAHHVNGPTSSGVDTASPAPRPVEAPAA